VLVDSKPTKHVISKLVSTKTIQINTKGLPKAASLVIGGKITLGLVQVSPKSLKTFNKMQNPLKNNQKLKKSPTKIQEHNS